MYLLHIHEMWVSSHPHQPSLKCSWSCEQAPQLQNCWRMGPAALLSQQPRGGTTFSWEPCTALQQAHVAAVSTEQQCNPTREMGGWQPKTTGIPGQILGYIPPPSLSHLLVFSRVGWYGLLWNEHANGPQTYTSGYGAPETCAYLHKWCILQFLSFLCKCKGLKLVPPSWAETISSVFFTNSHIHTT